MDTALDFWKINMGSIRINMGKKIIIYWSTQGYFFFTLFAFFYVFLFLSFFLLSWKLKWGQIMECHWCPLVYDVSSASFHSYLVLLLNNSQNIVS